MIILEGWRGLVGFVRAEVGKGVLWGGWYEVVLWGGWYEMVWNANLRIGVSFSEFYVFILKCKISYTNFFLYAYHALFLFILNFPFQFRISW